MEVNTEFGPAEKKRWYILLVFSMLTAFQSNTWFTYSSVPDAVEDYYHLHKPSDNSKVNSTIDLWLNWAPLLFLPIAPFAGYILLFPTIGLKYAVRLATTLTFIANIIRCIPTILSECSFLDYKITNNLWNCLIFIHIAQIFNSCAGPLVLSPPSKLSVIWFDEKQRVLATGIGAGMNTFGTCLGFILGPLLVKKGSDLPKLLYFDTLLAAIPFILSWLYFPNSPNKLPSKAAKQALHAIPNKSPKKYQNINDDMEHFQKLDSLSMNSSIDKIKNFDETAAKLSLKAHVIDFIYELKNLFTCKDAVIVGIIGGLGGGIFAGWAGVLQDMLNPMDLNDTQIGFIGFNISIMTAIGGICVGPFADTFFQKNLKKLIVGIYFIVLLILCVLFCVLPSPFFEKSLIIISSNSTTMDKMIALNVMIGCLGFFSGCLVPPYYELIAEVSYPISEGTSALYLMTINALSVSVFVGIGAWLNTKYETFFITIVCIVSVVVLKYVKEQYKRP